MHRSFASLRVLKSLAFALLTALGSGAAHAGEAQLSVGNVSVKEGNSGTTNLDFDVVRSGDSSGNIVVPYSVIPGTASAGSDYIAPPAGSVLRIPAGMIQGIVSVPVIGDTIPEPDETLTFKLGSPAAFDPAAAFVPPAAAPTPPSVATGAGPNDMVLADFDGDGRLDIATANAGDNTVSVILHDAGGALIAASNYPVGPDPVRLAVADFNGDGKPDIVTANHNATSVSVLLNDGTGHFLPATSVVAGSPEVIGVAAADFNGDGKPDLAVAIAGNHIAVLLNDGSGGFLAPVNYTVPAGLQYVAAGDFNGDGKPDLVSVSWIGSGVSSTNSFSVLLNDGSGGFLAAVSQSVQRQPEYIITADFNGDGHLDAAVATTGPGGAEVFFGDGSGGFSGGSIASGTINPVSLCAADFNGDGKPDLAVADAVLPNPPSNDNVAVSFNDGTGNFPNTGGIGYSAGNGVSAVGAADFNGDGKPDLVVASGDNRVTVLYNNGNGGFGPLTGVPSSISAATADFNGDGKPDVVTVGTSGATVLLGDGSGGLLEPNNNILGGLQYVIASDLDGDGKPDLAMTSSTGSVKLWLNDGSGSFPFPERTSYIVGTSPDGIAAADFDGDGKLDLAVANFGSHNVSVLRNNSTSGHGAFLDAVNYDVTNGALSVTTADFNGDGKPDLAVTTGLHNTSDGTFAGSVAVLLNDGSGGFLAPVIYPVGPKPVSIAAADFDGDGKPDLVVADYGDDNSAGTHVSVLRNDGSGGFLPAVDWAVGLHPVWVAAVDVNGDGKPDLVVAASQSPNPGDLAVLLNDGSGGFLAPVTYSAGGLVSAIAAVDLNGDGKPDLAAASASGLALLLNAPGNTAVLSNSSATGTILDDDPHVDPFSFAAVKNAAPSTVYTSAPATISGLAGPTPVVFKGEGAYSISGAPYTTAAGTVNNNDTVSIRLTSASTYKTAVHGGVVIGSVGRAFIVTTGTDPGIDTTPDAFAFTPVRNASLSSPVDSNIVTITGINVPTPVYVSGGGSYSIAGGSFTTAPGTISNGQTVQVRLTSAATPGTALHAGLRVGTGSAPFVVTTRNN